MNIPLAFERINDQNSDQIHILAADAGGTKTNIGLYKTNNGQLEQIVQTTHASAKFPSFSGIIHHFLLEHKLSAPDRISIGIAGPVIDYKVQTTNLPWVVDAILLKEEIGVKEVALINDLEATAYGLAALNEDDFLTIHDNKADKGGNIAVVAPGTGLGEAGLFWDGKNYHPFATEGGHAAFSPETESDIELFRFLKEKHGQVSWEHLIAGPAIYSIYQYLRDIKKMEEPHWLDVRIKADDPSAVISSTALQGISAICDETMRLFTYYIARECSNVALKFKATGGVYLAGGIPPKIVPYLSMPFFYESFLITDRMDVLINSVPVKVITNSKAPLFGAAYFGAYGKNQV